MPDGGQPHPDEAADFPGREEGPESYPDDVVLVVGGAGQDDLPEVSGVSLTRDGDHPYGLIAMLPGAECGDPYDPIARRGRLAVPVADFTDGRLPRADFVAAHLTGKSLNDALAETQPIRDRLRALPPLVDNNDRNGLMALRIAVTRERGIEGGWMPRRSDLIAYPLLAGMVDARLLLEAMAEAKLLRRRFFDRLFLCRHCNSARLAAREVCPQCDSANTAEETLVNHYRCGHQAQKSAFAQGESLVCPKCDRVLRHFGVDYDTPGHVVVCRECDHVASEPEVAFMCVDCGHTTRGVDVRTRDWYHYDLTSAAYTAVEEGRLPGIGVESLLGDISGRRSPRDLALMIDLAQRLRNRYKRPFSVLLVNLILVEEELGRIGRSGAARVRQMVVDLVRETIRDTDFVAALDEQLVLFLPETPHENTRVLVERLNLQIAEAIGVGTSVEVRLLEEEQVLSLVDLLGKN